MRYQGNAPVEAVLGRLKELGVTISARNYHVFLRRLLRLPSLQEAKNLGVNVDLLRAVRVRYRLPTDPSGARISTKRVDHHDSRLGRRPVLSVPKPKRPKGPSVQARPVRRDRLEPGQLPLPNMVAMPTDDHPYTRLHGTPDNPKDYHDWKIINEVARDKLLEADHRVMPNYQGGVIHLRTRKSYTPEDLVRLFKLTPCEAQSCYMTLDA